MKKSESDQAAVLVNECRVFDDRVVSRGGNLVAVTCPDREHADWLAAHMVTFAGIPKSAVKVEA